MPAPLRKKQERFAGLVERAAPGTHRAVADYIGGLGLPKAARCCDLAAGNGALVARLRAIGLKSFVAVEWNVSDFGLADLVPVALDLNEPFAERCGGPFDLVTAVEIVEHLENPRAFVAEARAALKDEGHLILTTPNVNHWPARLRYFVSGEIRHFRPVDIATQRHITPITEYQMAAILEECGLQLVRKLYCGSFYGPLKAGIMRAADALFASCMRDRAPLAEVVVYHAVAVSRLTGGSKRAYFADPKFALRDNSL